MKLLLPYIFLFAGVVHSHDESQPCDTPEPTTRTKVKAKEALKWYRESEWAFAHHVQDDIIIETVFHLINPDDNEITGNEQAQMDVLNDAFSGSGFQFNLTNITTYTSNSWWGIEDGYSPEVEEMLGETRVGGCETLNVWFTSLDDVYGFAFFPCFCNRFRDNAEGVVVEHSTGTGGSNIFRNEGHTLVHEVGHWMGLFHTFEGRGCGGDGDLVDDTPAVRRPNRYFCNENRDSCKLDGQGPDLVHNFMDYTYDDCTDSFTEGQFERMRAEWSAHRDPIRSVEFEGLLKDKQDKSLYYSMISKFGII